MNLKKYEEIKNLCAEHTKLIVVSKYRSEQELMDYYKEGQRIFAENRVQELCSKQEALPKNIEWHMIGHLQSNKVKYIAPFIKMIHSLDSLSLAKEINKQAKKNQRCIPVLVQVNLAKEETKSGISEEEVFPFIEALQEFNHIQLKGIMIIGPHCNDDAQIASIFEKGQHLSQAVKQRYPDADELSMGMSNDYKVALHYDTTMLRIGSILFEKKQL